VFPVRLRRLLREDALARLAMADDAGDDAVMLWGREQVLTFGERARLKHGYLSQRPEASAFTPGVTLLVTEWQPATTCAGCRTSRWAPPHCCRPSTVLGAGTGALPLPPDRALALG
jgi:hypothetical protein